MILAHLTFATPKLFETAYVPAVLGSILSLMRHANLVHYNPIKLLHVATVYAIGSYFIRAFCTIRQLTSFLDINCLSIKDKRKIA